MIEIKAGPIVGEVIDDNSNIVAYRGIPYAAPPVGGLRWKEPQPVTPWQEIRRCVEFGPACPQSEVFFSDLLINESPSLISEDCLYLNVWCCASAERRPVMVWIHGGGFDSGWGHQRGFDGAALARKGVVVVTINYRLGIFGFFAHPLLSLASAERTSGNYGLLDQIAALSWVQDNISAFGGDPNCVTIFGESAGAMSVNLLRRSPLAEGLFHRAISQSAPGGVQIGPNLRAQEVQGKRLSDKLLPESDSDAITELLGLSAHKLLQQTINNRPIQELITSNTVVNTFSFGPVIDEWVLPSEGFTHDVPLMLGINAEEGAYWASLEELSFVMESVENFEAFVRWRAGEHAISLLELYPAKTRDDIRKAFIEYFTDTTFAKSTREVAAAMSDAFSNTYLYCFSRRKIDAPINAAYHSAEIGYVFNNLCTTEEVDVRLSDTLSSIWVQFATTGDPNDQGLPKWPVYDADSDQYIDFNTEISVCEGLRKKTCEQL